MSTLIDHAMSEFRAAGWIDETGEFTDSMQKAMCSDILELLAVFGAQGHSGFSASYALKMFDALANFKPIGPLTGEDWEWTEVSEGLKQNKRCSAVFKDVNRFDGQAYHLDGIVWYDICTRDLEPDEVGYPGTTEFKNYFTNSKSCVPITFPYIPETVYKEAPKESQE